MESKELKSILEKDASARVLEHGIFGGGSPRFARVAPESLREVLLFLRDRFDPRFEWLEHLAATDSAGMIVLSYFLRAVSGRQDLVIKCALEPGPDESWVEAPSVQDLFGTAAGPETEIGELFGVRFVGAAPTLAGGGILPEGLRGFPMRKQSGVRA